MKKSISKKIVGGLLVALLVSTFGAVLVNAEIEDENINMNENKINWNHRRQICGEPPFMTDLTVEQRQEIQDLLTYLREDNASPEEVREALHTKLEEWGIEIQIPELSDEERDERLEKAIENTQQKLMILNRVKELRDDGMTYEEIKDIIQEEFGEEISSGEFCGIKFRHGYRSGLCKNDSDFMSDN